MATNGDDECPAEYVDDYVDDPHRHTPRVKARLAQIPAVVRPLLEKDLAMMTSMPYETEETWLQHIDESYKWLLLRLSRGLTFLTRQCQELNIQNNVKVDSPPDDLTKCDALDLMTALSQEINASFE